MKKTYLPLLLILTTVFMGCQSPSVSKELRTVADWMTGRFDSSTQAQSDTGYFDVSLVMSRIWHQNDDGVWLYVEQALSNQLAQPYRQRIYHVREMGNMFVSYIYELPNPSAAINKYDDPGFFKGMVKDDLILRNGCEVYLNKQGNKTFKGSTLNKTCGSSRPGTAYVMSEVTLTEDEIQSWDRGFDENDNPIWGAVDGPYIFEKKENFDLIDPDGGAHGHSDNGHHGDSGHGSNDDHGNHNDHNIEDHTNGDTDGHDLEEGHGDAESHEDDHHEEGNHDDEEVHEDDEHEGESHN